MRFRAGCREMAEAVGVIASTVATRTTKPTLQNVFLRAEDGILELVATDLEVSLRLKLAEAEVDKGGEVLVNAARLSAVLRAVEDMGHVDFEADGEGNASVKAGSNQYRLPTEDPEDFPDVPGFDVKKPFRLSYPDLTGLFKKTRYATAPDAGRYAMNGVLMEIDAERLRTVATDGKRLALAERPMPEDAAESLKGGERLRVVVPPKAMLLLERVVDRVIREESPALEAGLSADGRILSFRTGEAVLGALLVEGEFPPYQDVLPEGFEEKLEVPRESFLSAVRRANVLNQGRESLAMVFTFGGDDVEIASSDPNAGDARVAFPLPWSKKKPLEVGFNPALLIEGLVAMDAEEFTLELKDSKSAALLREGDEFLYVVMPIQIV